MIANASTANMGCYYSEALSLWLVGIFRGVVETEKKSFSVYQMKASMIEAKTALASRIHPAAQHLFETHK